MARTKKTPTLSADGMNWLQLMPFPAANPMNWWALARPHNSVLAAMSGAHAALQSWRTGADALRAMVRAQQDAMLAMMEQSLARRDEGEADPTPAERKAEANGVDAAEPVDFVTPMLEATRAYGRVGKAFIVAQRNTLRAFNPPHAPH
jgi:hypothetical protein